MSSGTIIRNGCRPKDMFGVVRSIEESPPVVQAEEVKELTPKPPAKEVMTTTSEKFLSFHLAHFGTMPRKKWFYASGMLDERWVILCNAKSIGLLDTFSMKENRFVIVWNSVDSELSKMKVDPSQFIVTDVDPLNEGTLLVCLRCNVPRDDRKVYWATMKVDIENLVLTVRHFSLLPHLNLQPLLRAEGGFGYQSSDNEKDYHQLSDNQCEFYHQVVVEDNGELRETDRVKLPSNFKSVGVLGGHVYGLYYNNSKFDLKHLIKVSIQSDEQTTVDIDCSAVDFDDFEKIVSNFVCVGSTLVLARHNYPTKESDCSYFALNLESPKWQDMKLRIRGATPFFLMDYKKNLILKLRYFKPSTHEYYRFVVKDSPDSTVNIAESGAGTLAETILQFEDCLLDRRAKEADKREFVEKSEIHNKERNPQPIKEVMTTTSEKFSPTRLCYFGTMPTNYVIVPSMLDERWVLFRDSKSIGLLDTSSMKENQFKIDWNSVDSELSNAEMNPSKFSLITVDSVNENTLLVCLRFDLLGSKSKFYWATMKVDIENLVLTVRHFSLLPRFTMRTRLRIERGFGYQAGDREVDFYQQVVVGDDGEMSKTKRVNLPLHFKSVGVVDGHVYGLYCNNSKFDLKHLIKVSIQSNKQTSWDIDCSSVDFDDFEEISFRFLCVGSTFVIARPNRLENQPDFSYFALNLKSPKWRDMKLRIRGAFPCLLTDFKKGLILKLRWPKQSVHDFYHFDVKISPDSPDNIAESVIRALAETTSHFEDYVIDRPH